MTPAQIGLLIAVAAAVTFALTPVVRRASLRLGLVDRPDDRKVHTNAVPRLGGVAIFGGFCAAAGLHWSLQRYTTWPDVFDFGSGPVLGVMAGGAVIFAVGLLDDVRTIGPGAKLVGQMLAAGIVVASGVRIDFVGNPFGGGLIVLGLLSIPLTLVYIVGFTNVINLIDGLDGLAAGVTAIAAATFLLLAVQGNRPEAVVLAAALIGACAGFLRYNFHPATIFMGDSGAMFLGFMLSAISLLGVMKSVAAIALAAPLMIIGVPVFDTASAIIRRLRHNRPIQEADRGHIHHRLLGRGFDQRQTVLIIYVWSAALGVGAYAMRWAATPVKLASFAVLAALSGFMAYWLGLFEAAHHHADHEHATGGTDEDAVAPRPPAGDPHAGGS